MSLALVFEHYGVQVNPDRQQQKTICPLGHERRASCSVTLGADVELFNCFSCGEGGDAITLIMLKEGVDAQAAKQRYEAITGSGYRPISEPDAVRPSPISGRAGYKPKYRNGLPTRPRGHFAG